MMKLSDLVKNVSHMSEDELKAHVQEIRHNKYVAKPAVKRRVEEEPAKKERNTASRKVQAAIGDMTEEQKAELLKKLLGE
jgi:L-arabinose isomerase